MRRAEFIKSVKGNDLAIVDGYLYRRKKTRKDTGYYVCVRDYPQPHCNAKLVLKGDVVISADDEHIHDPEDSSIFERKLKVHLKEEITKNPLISPMEIYSKQKALLDGKVFDNKTPVQVPSYDSIRGGLYNHRNKLLKNDEEMMHLANSFGEDKMMKISDIIEKEGMEDDPSSSKPVEDGDERASSPPESHPNIECETLLFEEEDESMLRTSLDSNPRTSGTQKNTEPLPSFPAQVLATSPSFINVQTQINSNRTNVPVNPNNIRMPTNNMNPNKPSMPVIPNNMRMPMNPNDIRVQMNPNNMKMQMNPNNMQMPLNHSNLSKNGYIPTPFVMNLTPPMMGCNPAMTSNSPKQAFSMPMNQPVVKPVRDQFEAYGEYIASKLRQLDNRSVIFVQKSIGDIIFDAEMGKYKA